MVLEGIHLVPGMVEVRHREAIVVQCLVAIEDEDLHRSHFWVRDHATDGLRPLEKYLDGMSEIRLIQDALIERARRCDVPVIMNRTLDQAMGELLDLVLSTADRLVRT
jgi:2-phosphoglycerate kinase